MFQSECASAYSIVFSCPLLLADLKQTGTLLRRLLELFLSTHVLLKYTLKSAFLLNSACFLVQDKI
jgi:hypothetical protein